MSGLLIAGQEPDALIEITPEGAVRLEYSEVSVDDPWEVDAFPVAALIFQGGGTLQVPESGNLLPMPP